MMLHIEQAVVVEGKYDLIKLRGLIDAPIFTTNGFGVMNDRELLSLLKAVTEKRGLIILTDSDGAGFVIRNYLKGALPKDKVLHAYIPDIYGKEKRKRKGGAEGKIGVEGISDSVLIDALKKAGVCVKHVDGAAEEKITKSDMYALGFSGRENSAEKREALKSELGLPQHLSTNALLDVLNIMFVRNDFMSRFSEER